MIHWLLIVFASLFAHDFHISYTDIGFDKRSSRLQISAQLFIDDVELALKKRGYTKLHLCSELEAPQADSIFAEYLLEHFAISADEERLSLEYLGKEPAADMKSVWCYFYSEPIRGIEELAVENRWLLEVYNDQKNMVNIQVQDEEKGTYMCHKGQERIIHTVSNQ